MELKRDDQRSALACAPACQTFRNKTRSVGMYACNFAMRPILSPALVQPCRLSGFSTLNLHVSCSGDRFSSPAKEGMGCTLSMADYKVAMFAA